MLAPTEMLSASHAVSIQLVVRSSAANWFHGCIEDNRSRHGGKFCTATVRNGMALFAVSSGDAKCWYFPMPTNPSGAHLHLVTFIIPIFCVFSIICGSLRKIRIKTSGFIRKSHFIWQKRMRDGAVTMTQSAADVAISQHLWSNEYDGLQILMPVIFQKTGRNPVCLHHMVLSFKRINMSNRSECRLTAPQESDENPDYTCNIQRFCTKEYCTIR